MNSETHADDPAEVATALRNIKRHTVGYGERYPQPDTDHFVAEDTNANGGVHHQNQSNEYGYDLTSFGSGRQGVRNFVAVLDAGNLDPVDDYYRVFRDMGRGVDIDYHDRFVFVWANEGAMVVCSNNPITGESNGPNINNKQGGAGYVGVAGETSRVDDIIEAIGQHGTTKSGRRDGGLFS